MEKYIRHIKANRDSFNLQRQVCEDTRNKLFYWRPIPAVPLHNAKLGNNALVTVF